MLTVHHLQVSQSERIVWLCEELGIEYELKLYERDSKTKESPPEIKALHFTQQAPIIQDGSVLLAETGAIVEYILNKYDKEHKLSIPFSPTQEYADYLFYLHFANANFQCAVGKRGLVNRFGLKEEDGLVVMFANRAFERGLKILDDRLKSNTWLAGDKFTAADVIIVFSLTNMRNFSPYSLKGYDGILEYLKRVSERDGYKRAMKKGEGSEEMYMGKL